MSLLDKASLVVTPNAYKASKLYSVIPNTTLGDMDVVRATTATRVNEQGLIESVGVNIPRIDYTNESCPSILVEPQRTNLLTYSNDFSNAVWTKSNSSIDANSIISPDGTQNANKLNVLVAAYSGMYQTGNFASNKYSMSLFAKKGTKDWLYFVDLSGATVVAYFNISNGTLGTVTNGTATIKNFGNGWYLCTYSNTNNIVNSYFQLGFSDDNNSVIPASSGYGYIYGAQNEIGSYPTLYIPTIASAVTRNADLISKTGISSLIGQTEGVLFVESATLFNDLTPRLLSLSNGTTTNRIFINYSTTSNTITLSVVSAGVTILNINYLVSNTTQFAKIAVRYSNTLGYSLWVNGVNRGSNTLVAIPASMSRLGFDNGAGGTFFFSKVKQVQLYKTALSDTEMATLTTL